MAETLKQSVLYLCEDLRAIDIVVGRVAEEFEGEDPLRPIMRSVVENTREQLKLLLQAVSLDEHQEWPEPSEGTMELVEGYFEKGKQLMEGI